MGLFKLFKVRSMINDVYHIADFVAQCHLNVYTCTFIFCVQHKELKNDNYDFIIFNMNFKMRACTLASMFD